ncbi:MAG: PepSY domain-containing protein [Deltaproteobacteria bacterium]|nr:PepSY domain-containing protein [Deltaproteobacteria bacterium]
MKLVSLNRKLHRWISIAVVLPLLVIVSTGLLLQTKKLFSWIQPAERRGTGGPPTVSFPEILVACRAVPSADIHDWSDIARVDLRPARGLLKVVAKNSWEIQIDATTGSVLQVSYRRSDLIESLHDGSWFHARSKYWVFLPAATGLLVLSLSGLYLFAYPLLRRKRPSLGKAHNRPPPPSTQ